VVKAVHDCFSDSLFHVMRKIGKAVIITFLRRAMLWGTGTVVKNYMGHM